MTITDDKKKVLVYRLEVEVDPGTADAKGMCEALKPFGPVISLSAVMKVKS